MNPRASRTALIVASVPLLTSRTCSTGSTRRDDLLGQRDLALGRRAEARSRVAAAVADRVDTAGWAWPRIIGPQEPTRSTYSRPSASVSQAPARGAMNRGVPPTARKARTGELTPPGVTAAARSNRAALAGASSGYDGRAVAWRSREHCRKPGCEPGPRWGRGTCRSWPARGRCRTPGRSSRGAACRRPASRR